MNTEIAEKVTGLFPALCEKELLEDISRNGKLMEVSANTVLVEIGSYVKVIPLVIKGTIKVLREDDDGNELFLYFLNPGQGCAMTLNCCMANKPSAIRAIAEDDSELLAIPVDYMDKWMKQYQGWKNFVLQTYSDRFEELLHTIDSIAFMQMDERLVKYLKNKAAATKTRVFKITHQQIAYDLNSSREVISRLLKQLEKLGRIKLGRNHIELISLV